MLNSLWFVAYTCSSQWHISALWGSFLSIQDFYSAYCTKVTKSLSAGKDQENSSVLLVASLFLSGTEAINISYLIHGIRQNSSREDDDFTSLQMQKRQTWLNCDPPLQYYFKTIKYCWGGKTLRVSKHSYWWFLSDRVNWINLGKE